MTENIEHCNTVKAIRINKCSNIYDRLFESIFAFKQALDLNI